MSYTTAGQQGLEAVKAKQWSRAIELLSRGLSAGTASPQWLLARAHAYQETDQYELALADAERAYLSALDRQHPKTREHLVAAQYRRAVVLGHLRRYADADACCVWAQQLIEGEKNFRRDPDDVATYVDAEGEYKATPEEAILATTSMPKDKGNNGGANASTIKGLPEWAQAYSMRMVMLRAMQALPKGDPGRKITVQRVPDPPTVATATATTPKHELEKKRGKPVLADLPVNRQPTNMPMKAIRVDFYQTAETVSLTLYAKGVDKEKLKVDTHETTIDIFDLPESVSGSSAVTLLLDGTIDSATRDIRVTPYKIEMKFNKKPAGVKWGSWGEQKVLSPSAPLTEKPISAPDRHISSPSVGPKPSTTPAGASIHHKNSRKGQKNWDAVLNAVEDDDAAPDGDDVNGFFKKIYASSTPEQQRAMVKSFVESNGTTLSTDWESVAKETVDTKPPEGVEAKKW